jgi:hypothetical protein
MIGAATETFTTKFQDDGLKAAPRQGEVNSLLSDGYAAFNPSYVRLIR